VEAEAENLGMKDHLGFALVESDTTAEDRLARPPKIGHAPRTQSWQDALVQRRVLSSLARPVVSAPIGPVQRLESDPGWRGLFAILSGRAADVPTDRKTQAIAAAGVSGAGGGLPHAAAIRALFGPAHADTVDRIRAHVGGSAAAASQAIGAAAYATGTSVAFAQDPDLHTAAHEAAHVVQQKAGVSLYGGVGQAGDAYERHADAVADAVVRREDASALLAVGPSSSGRTGSTVQFKRAPSSPKNIDMPPDQMGYETGDDYVDKGPYCDANADAPGCDLLYPAQRDRLVRELQDDVAGAMQSLRSALLKLRTEELMKQEEGGIGVFGILFIEGLEMLLTGGADRALEYIQKTGEKALEKTIKNQAKKALYQAMASAPIHKVVHTGVELAIKVSKEKVAKAAEDAEPSTQFEARKDAIVGLLDDVDNEIPRIQDSLQHQMPAHLVSDALLILAWTAYKPDNGNTPQDYENVLREKIARFKLSGLPEVGSFAINHGWQFENKRVFWMDKAHRDLGIYARTTNTKDDTDVFGLPMNTKWEFESYIPEEFRGEALKLNKERWGEEVTEAPDLSHPRERERGYVDGGETP
jgi:hypothetical protein